MVLSEMYEGHYPETGVIHLHFEDLQLVRVSDNPPYSGEYTYTPSPEGGVLHVAGMLMSDDIVIEPIPYAEVENPSGGNTITIGVKE